jgi:hypothetical protein
VIASTNSWASLSTALGPLEKLLSRPRSPEECDELILRDYRGEVERAGEPPRPPPELADPVERLLREWPELSVFGVDWLRAWAPYARRQIAGMARVLRRYPWMAELIGQGPVGLVNPYSVEAYVSRDGSEACISLASLGGWAYCSADGSSVRRLELEFKGLEPHGGWVREVYRPKGLLAFARAKEYVRIL